MLSDKARLAIEILSRIPLGSIVSKAAVVSLSIISEEHIYTKALAWFDNHKTTKAPLSIEESWILQDGIHIAKFENMYCLFTPEEIRTDYGTKFNLKIYFGTTDKTAPARFVKMLRGYKIEETDKVAMSQAINGGWTASRKVPKRYWDSIFIDAKTKEGIIASLDSFKSSEANYRAKGVPYRLGICLYGPPGTGKSSICHAIASHLEMPLALVTSLPKKDPIDNLGDLYYSRSNNGIIVLEDFDRLLPQGLPLASSTVLNMFDGMTSGHNRILILTTNNLSNIHVDLLRPGRIDHMFEIGYLDSEGFEDMIEYFKPTWINEDIQTLYNELHNLTPSTVQRDLMCCDTFEEFSKMQRKHKSAKTKQ